MGTDWWLDADRPDLLAGAEDLVRAHEARLSRFVPTSSLSALNRHRVATCPTLAAVARLGLRMREATGGAFDPTLGARLVALGYDRTFAAIATPAPAPDGPTASALTVTVVGDEVRLDGPGALDLGGIAKGYTVDRTLAWLLSGGAQAAFVDGGGDLRGAGADCAYGVGDGLAVEARHGAVATSSTSARRWRDAVGRPLHHLLDPRTGHPTVGPLETATVIAPDAATADALATAVLAAPTTALRTLTAFGAHALVRDQGGAWWITPGAPLDAASDSPRHIHSHSHSHLAEARS
jgi:thiamine biosynthesis lipoprotein